MIALLTLVLAGIAVLCVLLALHIRADSPVCRMRMADRESRLAEARINLMTRQALAAMRAAASDEFRRRDRDQRS